MTCPFEKKKCAGGSVQDIIKLDTNERSLNLQPQSMLSKSEFCYYQIEAGKSKQYPMDDSIIQISTVF